MSATFRNSDNFLESEKKSQTENGNASEYGAIEEARNETVRSGTL